MDVFDLYAKITLDTKGYENSLSLAGQKLKTFGSGLATATKNIVKMTAKATAAISGAAAAGVVALSKQAVASYANYEQLVGGVETIFKKSSKELMQYANDAWKTASMSANRYMETATGFSASLLQGLGGDTSKAAKYADRAIRDMSDNANKMGTDMSALQVAYAGFAKGNMTMLDNLKLGYGGTKTEMARLIKDAAALTDIQAELGVSVNESSMDFANIINAISVIQKKLDFSGTTAKEAMHTIQGTANATKAAWQNVVTAIAGGGDVKNAFGNLRTAIFGDANDPGSGLLANVLPRVKQTMEGIGEFVKQAAPVIEQYLPELIRTVTPTLMDAVSVMVSGVVAGLPTMIRGLAGVIPQLMQSIRGILPVFVQAGGELLKALVEGIKQSAPVLEQVFYDIAGSLDLIFPGIGATLASIWEGAKSAIAWWQANGSAVLADIGAIVGQLYRDFVKPIFDWLGVNSANISSIITGVLDRIKGVLDWVARHKELVSSLAAVFIGAKLGVKTASNLFSNPLVKAGLGIPMFAAAYDKPTIIGVGDRGSYKGGELVGGMNEVRSMIYAAVNSGIGQRIGELKDLIYRSYDNLISTRNAAGSKSLGDYLSGVFSQLLGLGRNIVQWHAQSYDQPTLIGVGDRGNYKGGELVGGTDEIMGMITRAVRNEKKRDDWRFSQAEMVRAFETALRSVKIELDDEQAGKFVTRTIETALY